MENLDSRLLRNQEEENAAARQLKEKKREQAGEEDDEEAGADGEPRSLRQRVQAARQALNLKERAKEKLEEKVTAPIRQGTSRALRWAWEVSIPSFGLGLIYVNIHVFLRFVLGEKFFCKLGEEWLPELIGGAVGQAGKTINKSIGIIEIIVLLILDLAVLFIILGSLAVIAMIVDFMQAGVLEKIATIIGGLTKIGWSEIKALFLLFANSAIK